MCIFTTIKLGHDKKSTKISDYIIAYAERPNTSIIEAGRSLILFKILIVFGMASNSFYYFIFYNFHKQFYLVNEF